MTGELQYVEGPMKSDERREALRALTLILETPSLREHHRQAAFLALTLVGQQFPPMLRMVK